MRKIHTTYRNTISLTLEQGDRFANTPGLTVGVFHKRTGRLIGSISSEYFKSNAEMRTTDDGYVIYVCKFKRH